MKDLIKKINAAGFTLLNEPKTVFTKLEVLHSKCGKTFIRDLASFKDKSMKCPNCQVKATTGTANLQNHANKQKAEAYARLLTNERIVSGEYSVLSKASEYMGNKIPIIFKHNTCGNIYEARPNSFSNGSNCPKCVNVKRVLNTGHVPRDLDYVKNSIIELGENKYEVLSEEYLGNKEYLQIKHLDCDRVFEMRYNDFQQGYRCSHCAIEEYQSNGERKVAEILDSYKIKYKREVKFKGLKYKLNLRVDFVLYDEDDNFLWLEYHGSQHFIKSRWNENDFEERMIRDNIKIQYAKDHEIPFEAINYGDDVESKLLNILNDYGLI